MNNSLSKNLFLLTIFMLPFACSFRIETTCCLSSPVSYPAVTGPTQAVYSANGQYIATANYFAQPSTSNQGDVSFFTVNGNTLSTAVNYSAPPNSSGPGSVAFSPNGQYVVTCQFSNVTLYTLSNGTLTNPVSYSLPSGSYDPVAVLFSPNGSHIAIANRGSNDITTFAVSSGKLTNGVSHALPSGCTLGVGDSDVPNTIMAFDPSPTSYYLAVGGTIHTGADYFGMVATFYINDGVLSDGKAHQLPGTSKRALSVAYSPKGAYLVALDDVTNTIVVFSSDSTGGLSNATSYPAPSGSLSIGISTDGACLSLVNGGLYYAELNSGILSDAIAYSLPDGSAGAQAVGFSPDGTHLVTANELTNDVSLFAIGCSATTNPQTTGTISQTTRPGNSTTTPPSSTKHSSSNRAQSIGYLVGGLLALQGLWLGH